MKYALYMFFLALCAIILGGMLGNMVISTDGLSWLGYSKTFAFEPGTFLNLDVIKLTFGLTITVNVAQIFLLVTAIVVYYKTAPKVFTK
ncbi:MAG: DUF4321 domain-containing protein [Ruminococcus sp.]|nr:DUF4321 domain-containing protein [Ruminococcus sp.]